VRGEPEHEGRREIEALVSKGPTDFATVFRQLRAILERQRENFLVAADTPARYCLDANIGPATLQAWGGRQRKPTIPVAWVEMGKAYVSYHLMSVATPGAQERLSPALKARMQGKTCFNFTTGDETLFDELEQITSSSLAGFKRAGFIA
jgi:hypothetical protein